jgi:SHAQKYF class myb-like DNA-binding protein
LERDLAKFDHFLIVTKIMVSKAFTENSGRWSNEEHRLYKQAAKKHGHNWALIAKEVRTRTKAQVKSHDQKYMRRKANAGCGEAKKVVDVGVQVDFDAYVERPRLSSISTYNSSQDLQDLQDLSDYAELDILF